MNDHVIEYVRRAGFFTISQLRWVRPDWPLLTALIERWRSETSTIHLKIGEMTLTLQNVMVLLGLLINDPPVLGTDDKDWAEECERLLDRESLLTAMKGGALKLKWVRQQFSVALLTNM